MKNRKNASNVSDLSGDKSPLFKLLKYTHLHTVLLMLAFCTYCKAQSNANLTKEDKAVIKTVTTSNRPKTATQNVIQDRKGNVWMAALDGVFKYDGKSFTNVISKVSNARFYSVLEDKKGNLWFGSLGSGVYWYDGKSFRNFTTKEGLAGNDVICIYEDKTGNIWLGTDKGASRYDGKVFKNFTTKDGLPSNDITTIIEDKSGTFWFGTKGYLSSFDGKAFNLITNQGRYFRNIRSTIEDKKGNKWFGGNDGLWRYDGSTFTRLTENFVSVVYEDKKGNIWTSSEKYNESMRENYGDSIPSSAMVSLKQWVLSRYDEKSLFDKKLAVTEINPKTGTINGILEANDGNIWFGNSEGVYVYDAKTIADFKNKTIR